MKIRIFTLAKELDIDSKVLIGVCQKVGIHLKDSPLASISEEEKERVLAFIKQGPAADEPADKAETAVPKREPVRAPVGKVPAIRALPARPVVPREARREPAESEPAEAEEIPEQVEESTPEPVDPG